MKQDRFLIAILAGIGLLVILALGLFFVRQKQVDYVAEDTPQGVMLNYVIALTKGSYERAYGYLADMDYKPTLEQFRQPFFNKMLNITGSSLQIGDAQVNGDQAVVNVMIINAGNGPFESMYRNQLTATLLRQGGVWKISNGPYPYWNWDWYQPGVGTK
jgi:hypothetical protein